MIYPKLVYRTLPAVLICGWMLLTAPSVTAQDPQFSQFFAAPLYLNPAFAGSTQQGRVGLNYRNQWPAIDANFTTVSAYADFYLEDKNSGIGAILTRDYVGIVGLQSVSFAIQYAYQLQITKDWSFRPGVQLGFINRSINFGALTFGDQFDPATGSLVKGTAEALNTGQSALIPDLSFGGLLYSRNAFFGVAAHHLTQPNQSILGQKDILDMKISVHAGYKFFFRPGTMGTGVFSQSQERSLSPVVQYRKQGQFSQADVGMYFTAEPLIIGTWYRGIPFNKVNGFANNESIVLMLGLVLKKGEKDRMDILTLGYSYDYTISKLGPSSGGAHEFSLVYSWPTRNPRKPPKDKLIIPCPIPGL